MSRVGRAPLGTAGIAAHEGIRRACARGLEPLSLLEEVARKVRAVVPYSSSGWLLTDPATLLHTGAYTEDLSPELHRGLVDNELFDDDVAKFADVARLRQPAVTLHRVTSGEPQRSARYRKHYAEHGYGAELRAAFRTRSACQAVVCVARGDGEGDFSDEEVGFFARITGDVVDGLRTSLLIDEARDPVAGSDGPGMLVLDSDGEVESLTAQAESWLEVLPRDRAAALPEVLRQVGRRAVALAREGGRAPARARVPLGSGRWAVVHGACLDRPQESQGRVAIVLESARRAELAPMLVELHDLTDRERDVTQLLVRGLSLVEIAATLQISDHTVRDHVKAAFAKLGVGSRPELTAKLFHEHVPTELAAGTDTRQLKDA